MPRNKDRPQQAYYNDRRWKVIREDKQEVSPMCECCIYSFATQIHHNVPFAKYIKKRPDLAERLAFDGDVSALCNECHDAIHNIILLSPLELEITMDLIDRLSKDFKRLEWQLQHAPKIEEADKEFRRKI